MTQPFSNPSPSTQLNPPGASAPPPNEAEYLAAFERVEALIRAVPEDELAIVNLDVPVAVSTVLGAWREILALRDAVAKLDGVDISALDNLKDYAQALGHAHSLYRASVGPRDPVTKLGAEVTAVREQLFTDAHALSTRGLLDEKRVAQLHSPSGYRNIAFDTLGLVAIFRENAQALAGKTPVTSDEVEHAARLAEQLIAAVGERKQGPSGSSAVVLLRQQAFTLFTGAYDEVRRAISYLRWRTNDVDKIAPSLWAGRGKRASTDDEAAPVETSSHAPAAPPATSAPALTEEVGVGLPGSSPF